GVLTRMSSTLSADNNEDGGGVARQANSSSPPPSTAHVMNTHLVDGGGGGMSISYNTNLQAPLSITVHPPAKGLIIHERNKSNNINSLEAMDEVSAAEGMVGSASMTLSTNSNASDRPDQYLTLIELHRQELPRCVRFVARGLQENSETLRPISVAPDFA